MPVLWGQDPQAWDASSPDQDCRGEEVVLGVAIPLSGMW